MRRPDGFVWMAVLALCSAVVVVCPWPAPALAEDPLARIYGPPLPGGKVRTYYIAAEETAWDYAPSGRDEAMGHPFAHGAVLYTERRGGRIGRVHTKAVYVEYTDGTFATQKRKAAAWAHTGLLGPVLRAEVGDVIRIIFKNKASRPYSLHPHGVLYLKADEGAPGNDGTSLTEKRDDDGEAFEVPTHELGILLANQRFEHLAAPESLAVGVGRRFQQRAGGSETGRLQLTGGDDAAGSKRGAQAGNERGIFSGSCEHEVNPLFQL